MAEDDSTPVFTEADSDQFSARIMAIGEEIKVKGGSFVALVEFEGGQQTTAAINEDAGPGPWITRMAARCNGNVDLLFKWIMQYAEDTNSVNQSIYLNMIARMR